MTKRTLRVAIAACAIVLLALAGGATLTGTSASAGARPAGSSTPSAAKAQASEKRGTSDRRATARSARRARLVRNCSRLLARARRTERRSGAHNVRRHSTRRASARVRRCRALLRAERARRQRIARKRAQAASRNARREHDNRAGHRTCTTPGSANRGAGGERGSKPAGSVPPSEGAQGGGGASERRVSALPVAPGSCPGVRPGAVVRSEVGQCTLAFLFRGSDGRNYMATAGHCILGDGPFASGAGERTWRPGSGPPAEDGDGRRIGEFAYAILLEPYDFALIRLDPSVAADPALCHFGGPTRLYTERATSPTLLHWFGQGLLLGQTIPARSAVAPTTRDPDHVYAVGAALPGDSGSGVITADGAAIGVLVTVGVHTGTIGTDGVDAGTIGITRLAPQLARAEQALAIRLALRTAPAR